MKSAGKNYYNASSILMNSLEAIERFQVAHKTYLKNENEDARKSMAQALQTVKMLQDELSKPDEKADNIRIGFLKQVIALERSIQEIHKQDLFPDLYRDSESPFRLLNDILNIFKMTLITQGDTQPFIELSSSDHKWKDYGVIAFCKDVRNNLESIRFTSLWDALQCYEKNKTQLTYTFEILSLTGNLGKE
jgi:hypothetical protein